MSFWSAIANFFKGFFRSIPALVTGIVVGVLTGNPVLGGILGGMAAAAVNTAINGGNFGQNILTGAIMGGIAGAIGPGIFKDFGGVAENGLNWANFVAGVKTGAAFGAVIGGISTAIHGGNVFQNVAMGALSGAVSSAAAFGIMKGATMAWEAVDAVGGPRNQGNLHPIRDGGLRGVEPSFDNPTGGDVRGCDRRGCGYYGADRDLGTRGHAGIDITSDPGQTVVAPFSGRASVDPYQYGGVRITSGTYMGRLLYVDPNFSGTTTVQQGQPIGTALDIRPIYPNITNHVHFELYMRGVTAGGSGNVNPTDFIFRGR